MSSWLPFYNIVFQDLVEAVKELVAEQKRFMKETELNQKRFHNQMLKIRKLEKREFLNIWAAHLKFNVTGTEEAVNSDVGLRPLIWKNKNLMELYASEKPSVYGRKLGRELFGEGKVCELLSLIIGKNSTRENTRSPCNEERNQLFKG